MSMKTFTLSSVCVLVYCMLLAVSGTTDLLKDKDEVLERLSLGAYDDHQQGESKTFQVAFATKDMATGLEDWKSANVKERMKREPNYHQRIRNLGILFICGWIFISFKLLFSK